MQRKAMVKLVGLQFKLHYRKGPDNKAADALSRVGHNFALQSSTVAMHVWLQEVTNAYATDPTSQRLLQELGVVSPNEEGYFLDQGLIRYTKKIWITKNSTLQIKIISAFHASTIGGYFGIQATLQRLSKLFW
jgi:hypothetical protein